MPARAVPRHNQATYASGALDVLLPRVSAIGFTRYRAMLRANLDQARVWSLWRFRAAAYSI